MKEEKEAICCTDVLHGGPLRLHYFMGHTLDAMSLMNKVTMVTFMEHMCVFVKEGLGETQSERVIEIPVAIITST